MHIFTFPSFLSVVRRVLVRLIFYALPGEAHPKGSQLAAV